jgi:hypothetical protein
MADPGAVRLADAAEDEEAESLFSYDEQRRRLQAALTAAYGTSFGYGDGCYSPSRGVYLEALFDDYAVYCEYDGAKFRVDYAIGTDGSVTFTSEPVEVRVSYEPLTPSGEEQTMSKTIKVKDAKGNEIELAETTVLELAKTHATKDEPVELAALKSTVESQGTKILELQEKNGALELAARTAKADASVDALVKAGKLDPKDRDKWHALALKDAATFTELSATLTPKRELNTETGSGGEVVGASAGNQAFELAVSEELKANPKLSREQAAARALDKNPKLYESSTARA